MFGGLLWFEGEGNRGYSPGVAFFTGRRLIRGAVRLQPF